MEVEKRGSSFGELLAIPEQDDWVYVDGKSTSCVAFVFELYKESGLFGDLANSIQVTEFTVSKLHIFFLGRSSSLQINTLFFLLISRLLSDKRCILSEIL